MHDLFSHVEVKGEVIEYSEHKGGYDLLRLMYRDQTSPAKFVNVFVWGELRNKVRDLKLNKKDRVLVKGELAYMEDARNDKHGIRLSDIEGQETRKLGF